MAHNPHVVLITETWLDSTIMDSELYIPKFDIVRLDHNRHGGGVLIYFRSTFICNLLFMGDVNFECIVVSLIGWIFVIFMFVCFTDPLVNNRCLIDCFPLCVFLIVMYFQNLIWLVILM